MWIQNYFASLTSTPTRRRSVRRSPPAARALRLESLEDRSLLSFTPVANLAVGPIVVAAHFNNNDAHLDLATASGNTVSVRLGDGQGAFSAATPFGAVSLQGSMAVGDFDDDGNLDMATITSGGMLNKLSVLLGNGDGAFQPHVDSNIWVGPQSVAAGDFNNDGKTDLVYTHVEGTSGQGWVDVRLSNGVGSFATSNAYELVEGGGAAGLAVADLNGDGELDVVTVNPYNDTVSVLMGNGDGTFYFGYGYSDFVTGQFPQAVAVGDFTGDGIPDLVTAGQSVDILPGLGDGGIGISTFGPPIHQSANSSGMTSVAAADFNGDGKLDVVTADPGAGAVSVLLGRGDGTLTPPIDHAITGSSPRTVAVGDFNGDGRPDVAAGNVLLNDGVWTANTPRLKINDVTKQEGHTNTTLFTFTVTLSAAYDQAVTVNYATANWSAAAGSDYQSKTGTVTFAPGETSKAITVAVNGDRQKEANETFFVNLSGAIGGMVTDSQGVGTILNDEGGGRKSIRHSSALAVDAAIDDWMFSGRKKRNR